MASDEQAAITEEGGHKQRARGSPSRCKSRGWRNRDCRRIGPIVCSGVFLTRDTVQGVGDPTSAHRIRKLWLLPWCRRNCLCRVGGSDVCILIIGIVAASSPRCDRAPQIVVYLRTLSGGGPHPSARSPTIPYSRKGKNVYEIPFVSISSSRLAVLMSMHDWKCMVIWDWKSSQVLFVCQSFGA